MPDVVGVRFKRCGNIYDFQTNGINVQKGDLIVVESSFGVTIGTIVINRQHVETPEKELKPVLRKATEEDLKTKSENDKFEEKAKQHCIERITARNLPMKLIKVETTLDKSHIIFYFCAEGRIDFRELVRDLAAKFKTRIEMRQIGVRDEAKLVGGIGICGREICCKTFLSHFAPISIKMAKEQELILNTGKLSGLCGRLMCCLGYEECPDEEDIEVSEMIPLLKLDEEYTLVEDVQKTILENDEKITYKPIVDISSSHQNKDMEKTKNDSKSIENKKIVSKKVDDNKNKRGFPKSRERGKSKGIVEKKAATAKDTKENTQEKTAKEKKKKRSRHKHYKSRKDIKK